MTFFGRLSSLLVGHCVRQLLLYRTRWATNSTGLSTCRNENYGVYLSPSVRSPLVRLGQLTEPNSNSSVTAVAVAIPYQQPPSAECIYFYATSQTTDGNEFLNRSH